MKIIELKKISQKHPFHLCDIEGVMNKKILKSGA